MKNEERTMRNEKRRKAPIALFIVYCSFFIVRCFLTLGRKLHLGPTPGKPFFRDRGNAACVRSPVVLAFAWLSRPGSPCLSAQVDVGCAGPPHPRARVRFPGRLQS